MNPLRYLSVLVIAFCLCTPAFSQDASTPAPTFGDDSNPSQSLGELARKARKDNTAEVNMSDQDAKKLFRSVDKILSFASDDSGFPQHGTVKRRLVGHTEVEEYTRQQVAKNENADRFARSELTMKKFGLLPRDFNLKEYLVKANGQQIAGYYDSDTKTISLLNWVPMERQEPILAHELTHALQDQNYGLKAWMKGGQSAAENKNGGDPQDDSDMARRAVVEGQAMLVYVDYLLAPLGRSLQNTPGLIYQMEEPAVKAAADSQLLHDAPMILREAGTFPYREGFIFEGELLGKGGKHMAFTGAFARPPRNTHEVLQPQTYIDGEKSSVSVRIPDVEQLLDGKYGVYDSGGIGELDVRALLKTYGDRKDAEILSAAWQGGAYVTFRKSPSNGAAPTTADMALLYLSKWKSLAMAQRFARLYAGAVASRYQTVSTQPAQACATTNCPASAVQITTEEGPVIIEQWADNTVLVSESLDQTTATKLRDAIRSGSGDVHAENLRHDELNTRLYDLPSFSAFQAQIGEKILSEIKARAK